MEGLKVSQVAENLKLSKVSIHKWVKRLTLLEKGLAYKENGTVYLKSEGIEAIKVNQKVNGNNPQKIAVDAPVNQVVNPHKPDVNLYDKLTERFTSEVVFLKKELEKRDETINRLLTTQGEERQRTDTIIMKLTNDVGNLQKLIEHKTQEKDQKAFEVLQKEIPVIQAWKPEPPADPLQGLGFFEKIWVQFIEPQKLRRYDS